MKIVFNTLLFFFYIVNLTSSSSSFAITKTWTGASGTNWMTGGNWGGTAPSAGDDLIFTGSANTNTNNNFPAGTSFNSITFAAGASAFTIGGNAFSIAGGGSAMTNNANQNMTINANVTFVISTPTISVVTGGTITMNGYVLGTVGLTKTGAGTLTLGTPTTAASQWTGTTTVSAGTLNLGNPGGDNYKSLVWEIDNLATLKWTVSNVVDNNAVMTVNMGGIMNFNSQSDALGDFAGGGSITNIGGSIYLTKPAAGDGSNFSGIASGSGNINAGNGQFNTQILSGLNTYTGQTTIEQGILSVNTLKNAGSASSLGAPTGGNATILMGSGSNPGYLQYTGTLTSTNRAIDMPSTAGYGATLDQSGSGTLTFAGNVTSSGASAKTLTLLGSTAGSGIISGVISNNNAANPTSLYKDGTGTWTLSGTNTYTGTTTLNDGTLALGKLNAISSSSKFIAAGGTLSTGGFSDNIGSLTLAGDATIALGTGNHSLKFAASNGTSWTPGAALTITGWTGNYNCTTSGSNGKVFTGSNAELSAAKLSQIVFIDAGGMMYAACQLSTGEIVPTNIVLPITLISFTGKKVNNTIELNWITASEINSNYYDVLRSSDGINFETIGKVNAAGNTSFLSTYVFTDNTPLSGVNYYKLMEYDFDGAYTTSGIIAVNNDDAYVFKINALYPNPASTFVSINFESEMAGSYYINLYDELGKELATAKMEGVIGQNQFNLPVGNYSNGKYFVRIISPKKESIISQIILQH